MYIFSSGQRRVKLCHYFGQPHDTKGIWGLCASLGTLRCVTPKYFNQCSNCDAYRPTVHQRNHESNILLASRCVCVCVCVF